jgi:hypothetical protein
MNALFFWICLPFLVFFTWLMPLNSLQAAQVAIVKRSRAVIYADTDMKVPLGYVRQGKKIKVGDVARENGQLLPIVVSGKIGYIKVTDLILKDFNQEEVTDKKDVLDRYEVTLEEEKEDRIPDNNHLRVSLGSMAAGSDWQAISLATGDGEGSLARSFQVFIEHRPSWRKFNWSLGMGYYSISQSAASLQTVTVETNFFYSPWNSSIMRIDLYGGLLFTGDVKFQENTLTYVKSGAGWGYTLGGILRVFTHQKLGLHLGAGTKILNVTSLNNLDTASSAELFNIKQVGGAEIYFGLSYEL